MNSAGLESLVVQWKWNGVCVLANCMYIVAQFVLAERVKHTSVHYENVY